MRNMIICLLFLLFGSLIFGCSLLIFEEIEDDYFRYELRRSEGYAIVMELTELGVEQTMLAIPAYVEGLPVRQIGTSRGMIGGTSFTIISRNLTRLYLPYTIIEFRQIVTADNAIIILQHYDPDDAFVLTVTQHINAAPIFVHYMGGEMGINVQFFSNFDDADNHGYFWLDFITEGDEFIAPGEPEHLGYIFGGWYFDQLGENPWDGVMPTTSYETLTLYANWILIK